MNTPITAIQEPDVFWAYHRLAEAQLPPARLRALLQRHDGDPRAALDDTHGLTEKQATRLRQARALTVPAALQQQAEALGIAVLPSSTADYPSALLPFDDAPPLLFCRGSLPSGASIALVGSRRATSYGRGQAHRFATAFVEAGLCVISGGAAGVDTAAHQGALQAGGTTVAVVACGLDYIYPAENRSLFERIVAAGGAIVSEFPLGTRPEPWRFPARNRIIAGLAGSTVVIESPENSGALITARNAAEYGRDVFVVPGPVDSGRSRGGHRLVQDGAALADSPEDVLESITTPVLLPQPALQLPTLKAPLPPLAAEESALLAQLGGSAVLLDELAESAGLAPAQALVTATLLELKGLIRRQPGNQFIRI